VRTSPAIEVQRILRVDHAGEHGAIGIYSAQIVISRLLWPDLTATLAEIRSHEEKHLARFDQELKTRNLRSCHVLPLWYLGGYVLGILTGLLGRKAIWACTAAVENTVCQHLQNQKVFLKLHDERALEAVLSIEQDELDHLDHACANGGTNKGLGRIISAVVSSLTALAIWLSGKL